MFFPRGRDPASPGSASMAWSRREFLRFWLRLAQRLPRCSRLFRRTLWHAARKQKVVIINVWRWRARQRNLLLPTVKENIPGLLRNACCLQSTFFGQVINHGILGHYVATTSLATRCLRDIQ